MAQRVAILFDTVAEGYVLYQGIFRGIEIRIDGRQGEWADDTQLFVHAYWQGHHISGYVNPFKTMATARKYARELASGLAQFAVMARKRGLPERANCDAHMTVYRNYRADHGLSYYDRRGVLKDAA